MTNSPPEPGLLNPFAFDEPYEQFRAALRDWYPEWRDARAALEAALSPVVMLYQTAATALVPDKQVCPWRVAGDALRAAGLADWPGEVLRNRGVRPGQRITTEDKIVYAVWATATAASGDDAAGLTEWAGKLADLYASDPGELRARVADSCDQIVRQWLWRAAPPFVARVKAEADRLGLTAEVVRGMPRLSPERDEQNAFRLWLDGWELGVNLVGIHEGVGKSEPVPSCADTPPPTAEITPEELAFWARPSGERIADLSCVQELIDRHAVDTEFRRLVRARPEYAAAMERIGFDLTADIHEEFIRLGETEGLRFNSPDFRSLADVRRQARTVLLSRLRQQWSIGWLHERCGRYLATFDWLEGALRGGPIGPVILAGRIDRTDDFAALWDIARDVAGARPLPPRPARTTGLNQHEVRAEVERLMSWCADHLPSTALPTPAQPPVPSGPGAGGTVEWDANDLADVDDPGTTAIRLPTPPPPGENPFLVLDWCLKAAFYLALAVARARRKRRKELGRELRVERRDGEDVFRRVDDVPIRDDAEGELCRSVLNRWWGALTDARRLCAHLQIPFAAYDATLKEAEEKLNAGDAVIRGVVDREIHLLGNVNRRLLELADSTTPAGIPPAPRPLPPVVSAVENEPPVPAQAAPADPPPGDPPPRPKLDKSAREKLIGEALKKRVAPAGRNAVKRRALAATVTVKQIETDTGIPASTVGDSDAWKVFQAQRSNGSAKKPTPKAHRPLTAKILTARPDPSARSPVDELADREDVEARYRSDCSPAELARFDAMTPAERSQALALLADQLDDAD